MNDDVKNSSPRRVSEERILRAAENRGDIPPRPRNPRPNGKPPQNPTGRKTNAQRRNVKSGGRNTRPPVRCKRKRNMTLYYVMVVVFVLLAVIILSRTLFFNVETFKVSGVTKYDQEQMLAAVALKKGDNLFKIDVKEVEKTLSNLMVYADEVKVRRKLPSTLLITVVEAVPKYNLEHNGGFCIISESGKILETGLSAPQDGLLNVTGFEIKNAVANAKLESSDSLKARILNDINENLVSMKFDGIDKVDLTDRTDIKLFYNDRIEIQLGSSYDISYKLSYTKAVLESIEKTYGDTYEGKLIYHSASSGMSAIASDGVETSLPNENNNGDNSEAGTLDENSGENDIANGDSE